MNWRVLFAALLVPSLALAEPPLPAPQVVTYPPGDDKIVVVKKGETAPYTGQLFEDNTALRWAVWLQQYRERYGLDLKAEQDRCTAKLAYEVSLRGIAAEAAKATDADLRMRLKASEAGRLKAEEELRSPSFFSRPGTWFGIGVATTLVTGVTAAILVNQSN